MEKPTFKQRVDGFLKFLWNSETKEFLGRGGRSWGEIGLFYLIYYSCLAGFFAATIAVFYQTIDADNPKLQGDSSLLKGNPGMGYQPMPDIDTTLIYARKPVKDREAYVKSIKKVLDEYKNATSLDNVPCDNITDIRDKGNVACRVSYTDLTRECNEGNAFGMADGQPCILLKLNKIYGWKPKVWDDTEVQTAKEVPDEIKAMYKSDRIWIYCHGENPADVDNIGLNAISYSPMQGFPLAFYPYLKQKDYRSPLVFVKFKNATNHLGLMIECKALAKNIAVDRTEKEGSVHFELLVEP